MITGHRQALRAATVLAVTALLLLLSGPPVRAAGEPEGRLLVATSAHGPFRDNLSRALFPPRRYVPRDEVTRTFWIKNGSGDVAHVDVAVLIDPGANELSAALAWTLVVGEAAEATVPGSAGECTTVPGTDLAPGEVQPVQVTLRVGDLQGQQGAGQTAAVDVLASLTQAAGTGEIDVCGEQQAQSGPGPGPGTPGPDPDCVRDVVVTTTGTPTCVPTAVAAGSRGGYGGGGARDPRQAAGPALALLGGGAVLLLVARRRRRDDAEAPAG